MDFIIEILFELYLELMMFIVPEEKATTKRYRVIATLAALTLTLGSLALILWGAILLFGKGDPLGAIPLSVGVVLSVTQIVMGFVLSSRRARREREEAERAEEKKRRSEDEWTGW